MFSVADNNASQQEVRYRSHHKQHLESDDANTNNRNYSMYSTIRARKSLSKVVIDMTRAYMFHDGLNEPGMV